MENKNTNTQYTQSEISEIVRKICANITKQATEYARKDIALRHYDSPLKD